MESINLKPEKTNTYSLADIVKSYEIIPLSLKDDFLTNKIRKIHKVDDKFFVLDRQDVNGRILVFDENGKPFSKIHSTGKGPEEYLQIVDFDIIPKQKEILIADSGNRKVMNFSFSGRYISSKKINHWVKNINYMELKNSDPIIVTSTLSSHSTGNGDNYDIFIFDDEMNFKMKYLEFTVANSAGMGNGYNFYETSEGINYYQVFSNLTYQITNKGELINKNEFIFPANILPSSLVMEHAIGNISLSEYVYFVSYFETNDLIIFTYSWDKKDYLGLYNKKQQQSKVAEIKKLDNCPDCFGLNLVGVSENFIISYSTPNALPELLELIDPLKEKCLNSTYLSNMKLSENDNSIILLLNLE